MLTSEQAATVPFAISFAIRRLASLLAEPGRSEAEQKFYTYCLRTRLAHCPEPARGTLAQMALETVRGVRHVQ